MVRDATDQAEFESAWQRAGCERIFGILLQCVARFFG
jgi:hypothetical protein